VLSALREDAAVAGLVPRLVAYDETAGRLVLESPGGGLDWGRRTRLSPACARSLGRALAIIHQARVEVEPLRDADQRLWGLSLLEPPIERVRSFSAGAIELLARVQAYRELHEPLAGLREQFGDAGGFAHGDLRWENCLLVPAPGATRRTRVLLIDFEHAGPGVPAFDVASALAEYLRAWVESIPDITPETDPRRLLERARIPHARLRAATASLWGAYQQSAAQPLDAIGVTRLAAVRVLETAFEFARGASSVSGHIVALGQLVEDLLLRSGFAAWNVLGLRA
jgi:aminoglycoside phosphotransferase (APT) family kinase protein